MLYDDYPLGLSDCVNFSITMIFIKNHDFQLYYNYNQIWKQQYKHS